MSDDNIGNIIHFWKQISRDEIREELFDLFCDRMMNEADEISNIHIKIVLERSFEEIRYHAQYNFITYVFVKIFRCRVPIHSIEDVLLVVQNSPAERKAIFDELAITFIRRTEKEVKKRSPLN